MRRRRKETEEEDGGAKEEEEENEIRPDTRPKCSRWWLGRDSEAGGHGQYVGGRGIDALQCVWAGH